MRSIVSMTSMSYGSAFEDLSSGQMNVLTISDIYQNREVSLFLLFILILNRIVINMLILFLQYGDFWVVAKIVGIESSGDWFYVSCKGHGCNKKLILRNDGQKYDCDKCKRTWEEGILRYRVKVRVVDLNGNAPFILWDRECQDLLGISATDLRKRTLEVNYVLKT